MKGRKRVRFVHLAVAEVPRKKGLPPVSHIVGVDTRKRVWERYSDMPSGVWGEIEAPNEPTETKRRR